MRRLPVALLLLVASCGADATSAPLSTTVPTGPPPAVCGEFGTGALVGTLGHDSLTETSGIVMGATGTLWAHNDSGSEPRIYAMAPDGAPLGVIDISARNVDWEDIAAGPGPGGGPYLYLADIGDNLGRRRHVTLYRFPEPPAADGLVTEVEALDVTYPNGPSDAETLIVDPLGGDAYIVTKTPGWGRVYEVPAAAWGSGSTDAIDVGVAVLPRADSVITGGDVSSDGSLIALRTYGDVRLIPRSPGGSIGAALTARSCFLEAVDESQGEAIAFDGTALLTAGEGSRAALHRYERRP